jgi:hypothetical protein
MLDRFYDAFATAQRAWAQFSKSRVGGWVQAGIYWAFLAGIVGYLAYQLTDIGWERVWASLPTTPWFYILFLLMYATLPATEVVLYGAAWGARYRDLLPALLRKRVLNNDVLGYSGEAYFYLWAYRETNLEALDIARTIKDNVIISSVASTSVAFSLLALFFVTGQIDLLTQSLPSETSTLAAGVAVVILIVSVGVNFRRALFSLPSRILWLIGGGHLLRFGLNNGFQVLQWAVVIPEVSVSTWITLLALYIVIQQVPFVPTRSLVFMSAGVELSGVLQIPTAALASMLLVQTLIDRLLNFATYVGTTALDAATVEDAEALEDLSLADEVEAASEGSSA